MIIDKPVSSHDRRKESKRRTYSRFPYANGEGDIPVSVTLGQILSFSRAGFDFARLSRLRVVRSSFSSKRARVTGIKESPVLMEPYYTRRSGRVCINGRIWNNPPKLAGIRYRGEGD